MTAVFQRQNGPRDGAKNSYLNIFRPVVTGVYNAGKIVLQIGTKVEVKIQALLANPFVLENCLILVGSFSI